MLANFLELRSMELELRSLEHHQSLELRSTSTERLELISGRQRRGRGRRYCWPRHHRGLELRSTSKERLEQLIGGRRRERGRCCWPRPYLGADANAEGGEEEKGVTHLRKHLRSCKSWTPTLVVESLGSRFLRSMGRAGED